MINFAYSGLVKISCDCLQHDGHEVTNLTSLDKRKRLKGFLADRFIKPPVTVTLLFICDVDVSKIIVNPSVGSQRSAGIELSKVLRDSSASTMVSVDERGKNLLVFSRNADDEGSYKFCNERVASRVKMMRLRIYKTSNSTLPALSSLEIWGTPSANVPHRIRKDVDDLWKKIAGTRQTSNVALYQADAKDIVENKANTKRPHKSLGSEINVPDEFVDPISCEIMTIPMILPSGNVVDISTLEKFYAAEEKQGRGRSDPFTGVLFKENHQPVVATALKSRLDRFLLEHSDDPTIKTLPRTVGRKASRADTPSQSISFCSNSVSNSSGQGVRSVDQLLEDCLNGLPSYLDSPVALPTKKLKSDCVKCSHSKSIASSYSFKLPCDHIVCRQCLSDMKRGNSTNCPNCGNGFEFSSVERFCV